jgi:hypothetical protein
LVLSLLTRPLQRKATDTEDIMKTSNVKFQDRKMFTSKIWNLLSRHFRKTFLILTILCTGCAPKISTPALLPVTGAETQSNISYSPEMIDFGIRALGNTSAAKKVTIRNDGSAPLLIDQLSVSAGFSIVACSCPKPPDVVASQGTCTVEVVFKPSLPENWVGKLQVHYDSARVITIQLKGSAQSELKMLASITH